MGEDPRFPFGFGLSYTTFSLSGLTLDSTSVAGDGLVGVSVNVTNQGALAGDEVVRMYVSCPASGVDRAVRELKGFQRVSLGPGETRTVAMNLAVQDLAYWDVSGKAFVVEPLTYVSSVGTSSRDLPLTASFSVPPG